MNPEEKLMYVISQFNLSEDDTKEFSDIVSKFYYHEEFQKRMTDKYLHHGTVTLGEHILEDALNTYKVAKRKAKKNKKIDVVLATKIAMMHDLYEMPWQNQHHKVNYFIHMHGFRHPIEAAINSAVWFKDEFKDKEQAKMIIDGIVHHMYPLPVNKVRHFDCNYLELMNFDKVSQVDDEIKDLIIESTKRKNIARLSISRSKYKEGRIMSNADKLSAISNLKSVSDAVALVTGNNKRLDK